MMAPSSGAGRTPVQARGRLCCGTPRPANPLPQRRRTGPMGRGSPPALCLSQSLQPSRAMAKACCPTGPGTTAAGPLPTLPARPVGNPGQAVPTHRAPHQEPAPYWIRGTLRLRGRTRSAFRQQRRRTQPATSGRQPQGQRRHPLGAGHRAQDDAGIHLRHLARPRSKSSRRLPSAARFPSTLNCYVLSTPLTRSE